MVEIHPRTAALGRRPIERIASGALVLLAALLLSLASAGAALAAKPRAASLSVATPKVSGVTGTSAKLRVSGTVKLPSNLANTARNRHRLRVAVTLQDPARKTQSFTAKIDAKRRYAVTRTTTLRGALTVRVQTRVSGKPSGKAVTKKVTVKLAGSGGGPSGGGAAAPGPATPAPVPVPAGAEKLVGLLRLDAGWDNAKGERGGTYFRMFSGAVANPAYLVNQDSTSRDKTFTFLAPGSDGGLRTDTYQPAPFPAFAKRNTTGDGLEWLGDALADRIVQPQRFFSVRFSIVTNAVDYQTGDANPLPELYHQNGRLSGRLSYWNAQWNGESFQQGSPKPNGTTPSNTTPVTGTYDAVTRRFVVEWTSNIVGGPFNGFSGYWHLEGTFAPTG